MPRPTLSPNCLETIRQAASEVGGFEASRIANAALRGTSTQRRTALRKLAVR